MSEYGGYEAREIRRVEGTPDNTEVDTTNPFFLVEFINIEDEDDSEGALALSTKIQFSEHFTGDSAQAEAFRQMLKTILITFGQQGL